MTIKFSLKYISKVLAVGAIVATTACSDDFFDINDDPTRISESRVTLSALLPATQEAVGRANYSFAFSTAQICQHISSGGGADAHSEVRFDVGWSNTYLSGLANLNVIIQKAGEQNAPHFAGVAKIMSAYLLAGATASWENIAYAEAFDIKNLKPKYDSQESIYQKMTVLLDEGIADLAKTSTASPTAANDLFFKGNLNQWRRFANLLKARYAMHFSLKNATTAANNALTILAKDTLTANTDDAQLVYNDRNLNPWHSGVALANVTGNFSVRHSAQLVDAMNGVTFGVWDPRLPLIAGRLTANANATTWLGAENGTGGGNLDFVATSWHSRNVSPLIFATFSEQQFIRAEAEFLKNGGTATSKGTTPAAYNAYLSGIRANLDKLGVSDTGRTRYLGDARVAVGAANLTLQLIMAEKHKAQFLNPEFWNDMRRWDYSRDVFRDLELPRNHNPDLGGKWIQRANYPLDEYSRNGEVAKTNFKAPNVPMWIFTK